MNEELARMVAMKNGEVASAIREAYRTSEAHVPKMEDESLRFAFIGREFRKKLVELEAHYERFFISSIIDDKKKSVVVCISDLFNMSSEKDDIIEFLFDSKPVVSAPPKQMRKVKASHDRSHIHNVIHYITINYGLCRRNLASVVMNLFECSEAGAMNWIHEMEKAGTLSVVDRIYHSSFSEVPGKIDPKHEKMISEHIGTLVDDNAQVFFCAFTKQDDIVDYAETKSSVSSKALRAMIDLFIVSKSGKVTLTEVGKKVWLQTTPYRD